MTFNNIENRYRDEYPPLRACVSAASFRSPDSRIYLYNFYARTVVIASQDTNYKERKKTRVTYYTRLLFFGFWDKLILN